MNKILESYSEEQDTTIAVIQELIPLGLKAVGEELQREVQELAGKRYQHGGDISRWGFQAGSVYLRDQKLPIMVPRIRHTKANQEIRLTSYEKLQQPFDGDRQTFLKLLTNTGRARNWSRRFSGSAPRMSPNVFAAKAPSVFKHCRPAPWPSMILWPSLWTASVTPPTGWCHARWRQNDFRHRADPQRE